METFNFSLEQSIEDMKVWIDMFYQIKHRSLVIDYETVDLRPHEAAWRISDYLGIGNTDQSSRAADRHSKAWVKAMSDRLTENRRDLVDLGFSQYDPSTFYHRFHVSSLESRSAYPSGESRLVG